MEDLSNENDEEDTWDDEAIISETSLREIEDPNQIFDAPIFLEFYD